MGEQSPRHPEIPWKMLPFIFLILAILELGSNLFLLCWILVLICRAELQQACQTHKLKASKVAKWCEFYRATKDFHVASPEEKEEEEKEMLTGSLGGWIVINLSARQRDVCAMNANASRQTVWDWVWFWDWVGTRDDEAWGVSCSSGQNNQIPRITRLFVFVKQSRPLVYPATAHPPKDQPYDWWPRAQCVLPAFRPCRLPFYEHEQCRGSEPLSLETALNKKETPIVCSAPRNSREKRGSRASHHTSEKLAFYGLA